MALDRALDKAEDKAKLVDVLNSLSEARATITAQQEQIRDLQARLDLRAVMEYRAPAYWEKRGDDKADDGPFCSQCWESEEKKCRLHPTGDDGLFCKTCGSVVGERQSREVKKARSSLSDFYSAGT